MDSESDAALFWLQLFQTVFQSKGRSPRDNCSFSYPVFKLIESRHDIFTGVTAFAGPAQLNVKASGAAQLVRGEIVSGGFFQTLGVRAGVGRTLDRQDDSPRANAVVVLSYGYWQSAFGGDRSAVGKTIRLNGVPFMVVGVAERSFSHLSPGRVLRFMVTYRSGYWFGRLLDTCSARERSRLVARDYWPGQARHSGLSS